MQVSDFDFVLPDELIARFPSAERTASRLLQLDGDSGALTDHASFTAIEQLIQPGDLLVFNNTRVIPARLHGQKASGGKVEVLVERVLDSRRVLAHVRASKAPKPGNELLLEQQAKAVMLERHDALFELEFDLTLQSGQQTESVFELLEQVGHMPLPPYIDRPDESSDRERYQTVYNEKPGAVAAPTAGLHFDEPLLERLKQKGVELAFVTLHVGAGTFQPVRVDNVLDHKMHAEYIDVPKAVVEQINNTRARGGRVIAVGTTSVRSLESAAQEGQKAGLCGSGELAPFQGDTEIFIYPGYQFQVIDAMVTNFHLPQSTLLMLISAFAGYDQVMAAYKHAVEEQYRFFSYGDAMFISRR